MQNDKIKQRIKKIIQTAEFLYKRLSVSPEVGFLTGTGLGKSVAQIDISEKFDYSDIPNFPVSTVEGHTGKLVCGSLSGRGILAMQGRFHLYEGYSPFEVTFPVRVMQKLGVKYLVISNASGGINPDFSPGDIMIIRDHINLTGKNPLTGPNDDTMGIRFPDMTDVYDKNLAEIAKKAAHKADIPVTQGVYAGLLGPSLETPAETKFLRFIGGDAVGFSTVMEAIAGTHAGMKILGLASITNINNPDKPEKASIQEIIHTAEKASSGVGKIFADVVKNMDSSASDDVLAGALHKNHSL